LNNSHAPKQSTAGDHFDQTIRAKADHRNTARERSSHHGYERFDTVPGNGEILEFSAPADGPSLALNQGWHGTRIHRTHRAIAMIARLGVQKLLDRLIN
jgi:hypothetical protein